MRPFPEIIHFLVSLLYVLCFSSVFSIDGDFEILTRVKNTQLIDPEGKLKDWVWVSSNQSPCDWTGVECDNRSKSVIGIDLSRLGLSGGFPSGFCWVRTLQKLNLVGNNLNGSLSFRSLAPCFHLQELRLSDNVFDGELPEFSTGFSQLRVLDLSSNNFTGDIPERYGQFPALQCLSLAGNSLTGTIPPFLGNLTELTHLLLGYNPFKRGGLPSEIGNLSKLEVLWLSGTNLVGEIPESIGNLGSLKNLDLSINLLTGRIPESLGALKSVIQIELYDNRLYGELLESLANLTSLLRLDVSQNNLTGELPEKVSALLLESLNLNDNFFTGEISEVLATNPNLVQLKLFNNSFTGKLPENLGKNSELQDFDVSTNDFTGEFPRYLCYRNKLERIVLFKNRFSGEFSGLYGYCKTLNYVRMADNQFSGEVPARFWGLPVLEFLELNNNKFVGSIPSSLSSKLTKIIISNNDFSGPIPTGICGLSRTIEINLRGNRFSGELPSCLTELKKLQKLDLHGNELRGELLSSVSSWADLTELNLGSNNFTGKIPSELGNLPVLKFLDLSSNSLTGPIPKEFIKLKLNQFNVSNNKLYGEVPSGLDNEVFVSGLLGNPNLCSPDLEPLPPCAKSKPVTFYCIAVLIACGLLLLALFAWVLKNRSIFRKKNKTPYKVTVFQRVAFTGDEILRSLTEGNAIASGGSARVYRVKPKTGQTVAAKLLWDGAEKAETEAVFRSETAALGRIRHSNIVRLLMCLSGEEMRVLVFEYMEKGSLGEALHGEKCAGLEDWPTRFTIALGTAQGLAYLHQDCVPAIVHRDVKSSNILLDQEMQPRLADFGLAKTLQLEADDGEEAAMSRVAGSYGYIAPEYAYTLKVSEKSDVYSFGVVVMELITGKRPLLGNKDIVKWVTEAAISSSPPQNSYITKLIDPRMKASKSEYREIEKVLNVALLCTSALPINRPSMRRVVDLLKDCKQGPPN